MPINVGQQQARLNAAHHTVHTHTHTARTTYSTYKHIHSHCLSSQLRFVAMSVVFSPFHPQLQSPKSYLHQCKSNNNG